MTRSRVKNDFSVGIDDDAASTAIAIDSAGQVRVTANGGGVSNDADITLNLRAKFGYDGSRNAVLISDAATNKSIVFDSNGLERVRLNTSGQVLIGTTSNSLDGNISGVGTSSNFTVNGSISKFQVANTGNLIAFSRSGANYISATDSSASLILDTPKTLIRSESGSEYARFDSDGLKFNGDTAAANALDDYEEGTWTPVLTGTTSGTKNLAGTYTKVGRCVTVRIGHWTAIPSGTVAGSLYITGLPFNSAGNPWGNNGAIASSGLLHVRGTSGGIGTSYAPFALIETNRIKLHDSANFGNTNVYAGQGATFPATKISQNGSTSIIIDWEFSYMTA